MPVLDGVSLHVGGGEIVTLLGPSGVGKTSLLRLSARLVDPQAGHITLNGQPVEKMPVPVYRRRVALIPQVPVMLPGTVRQNLFAPVQWARIAPSEARRRLEKILSYGLVAGGLIDKEATVLSEGQRARVALARALMNQPDVLLVDEITAALDPTAAADLQRLLRRLAKGQGMAVLWATHQIHQAREVGDRTALLIEGRIEAEAPTDQFFNTPASPIADRFIRGLLH